MLISPVGFRSEKGCAGDAHQQLNNTAPTSQRGRPTSTNPQLSKNKGEGEKVVGGPRWMPDTKTDWPTDRRS
jgi:hypothetical protein